MNSNHRPTGAKRSVLQLLNTKMSSRRGSWGTTSRLGRDTLPHTHPTQLLRRSLATRRLVLGALPPPIYHASLTRVCSKECVLGHVVLSVSCEVECRACVVSFERTATQTHHSFQLSVYSTNIMIVIMMLLLTSSSQWVTLSFVETKV